MPQNEPTAEHLVLKKLAGTWNAVLSSMGGSSKGVYTVEQAMNRLWVVQDFKGDFGGTPFQGHGVTGYDTEKKKYVAIWVDSMTTHIASLEGSYDAEKETLSLETMGTNPATGEKQRELHRTSFHGTDAATFEMVVPQADGTEMPPLTIEYTRKK